MNPDWKAFLIENGAEFIAGDHGDKLVSFADPRLESQLSNHDALLCNASDRALIEVKGEDAESFLQNQLSNDIRNVSESSHQQSAWCNPKGRIIANFRIFKRNDAFYLSLSLDLVEVVLKKLRMYVMMSKVSIEDVSDTWAHFILAGKGVDMHLQTSLGISDGLLNDENQSIHINDLSILHIKGDPVRFEIFGETDALKSLWIECEKIATPVSGDGFRYLNIIAGIPEITAASSEAWIPQMVNYIQIGGVDFKKGCYPGQEVVARLNYLGKTKRRMYHLEIDSNELPETGDSIKTDSDDEAGKILNAVTNAEGKVQALAVLKIAVVSDALSLAKNDGNITLLDLPYAVEDE